MSKMSEMPTDLESFYNECPPYDAANSLDAPELEATALSVTADGAEYLATPILPPAEPLFSARTFLRMKHNRDGLRTLHHQNASFYKWQKNSHYVEHPTEEIRAELYEFLDGAKRIDGKDKIVDFAPNKTKVANIIEALAAASQLPGTTRPPAWPRSNACGGHHKARIGCRRFALPSWRSSKSGGRCSPRGLTDQVFSTPVKYQKS